MKKLLIGLAIASIAALGACSGDASTVFTKDNPPLAFVRFVNAVSDSSGQDWRFVDQVENTPTTFSLQFRGVFPGTSYQGLGAGSRHLRIFQSGNAADPNLSTPAIVSQVLFDTTFSFTAGTHYTIIAAGTKRAGSANPAKVYIFQDDLTDPGSSVGVRVINAGAGASVDVYGSATGGTSALPSSPLFAGVAQFTASKNVTMATGPLALRVFPSGTNVFPAVIDATAPAGAAADRANNLTAVGGSTIAGSVFTAILFPQSVAGSTAAKFTTPGVVYVVDKYPPSGF